MRILKSLCRAVCAVVLLSAALSGPAYGADAVQPAAAADRMIWQVASEYSGYAINLRVAGPQGFWKETNYKAGEQVEFPVSQGGAVLSDGLYSWEIIAFPAKNQKKTRDLNAQVTGESEEASERLVFSGAFTIAQGQPVYGNVRETPAAITRDNVVYDDQIVTGSLCVGMDCVDGESFGSDTIRLKENNTRIKFEDTSTGAFPTNDWELTANDIASGGLNRFSILDVDAGRNIFTLEAGAKANSLYISKPDGRVGLGTSTPAEELHILWRDTPTIRLDQDNSNGYSPQTWDVAANESNFFIRDVTHGSQLPFRIIPGAPTNSLYINSEGKTGLGTYSPSEQLHVQGNVFVSGTIEVGSSRTLKQNIEPLTASEALAAVKALEPVRFAYKSDPEETTLGFIAEDVPELVATNERRSVNPMDVIAALTRTVQEQQRMVEAQAKAIDELMRQVEALRQDMSGITTASDRRVPASQPSPARM